eukprot:TRINITY_DN21122_c0_g1_i1.p1 TRINITY_DN21122_c0_g1~~TRINITY_DN21122_c0_g1_i1.p1  ORF type:complete len:341 (+),score=78.26 TRINITY_DN21122_c0_g1_i1:1063-2085(+)
MGERANCTKVESAFARFDLNGDGCIDRSELKRVLQALDTATWTDRRLSRLLNMMDKNRDGRIQYLEFVRWACGRDDCSDLQAFRRVVNVSQDEARAAPTLLAGSSRSSSRKPLSKAPGPSELTDAGAKAPSPEEKSCVAQPGDNPSQDAASAVEKTEAPSPAVPPPCLLAFDFDSTITVDKDERYKGLRGERLERLLEMMRRIRCSSTAHCVLVTAQFPFATQEKTIPLLTESGLAKMFVDEAPGSKPCLYREDPEHGTIYNGAEVMLGKIGLLRKIISGQNCWEMKFDPDDVLFIDDSEANFKGNEHLGVHVRKVEQDGMLEEDMAAVEAFLQARQAAR